MISHQLEQYIQDASSYARSCQAPSTSLVYVLLALTDDRDFRSVLELCGVNYLDIRQETIDALAERVAVDKLSSPQGEDSLSALCLITIESAKKKAAARGEFEASVLDFVAAILEVHDNGSFDFNARIILMRAGLTVTTFAKARGLATTGGESFHRTRSIARETAVEYRRKVEPVFGEETQEPPLPRSSSPFPFCTDMTDRARNGAYDRSHGREDLLSALQVVLSRRKKRSAVLVGEPGVGKTSIVEELACRIVEGKVGPRLSGTTVLSLDIGALVGGTKYRGELEERVKALVAYLAENPQVILFVDEVHVLVSPTHSAAVAADLLKPALASGAVRCIGATTLSEYKRYFEADAAMSRRFASLSVHEPTRDEAVALLDKASSSYAEFHGVVFPEWAFATAVDVSIRFMPERRLPDKALELLDDVAARASMIGADITEELIRSCATAKTRRKAEVDIVAAMKSLDVALVPVAQAALRNQLTAQTDRNVIAVIGPSACDMKVAVKRVADAIGRTWEPLDMADFREQVAVSALLGPPPGYVGFDNGGRLYDIVKRSPDCVLHLVNADQAHPAALAVLEECMTSGFVRDSTGRVASLVGVQVIATAIVERKRASIGFSSDHDSAVETGIDFLDGAETVVALTEPVGDLTSDALASLVAAAKAAGTVMTLADGLVEHVRGLVKSSNLEWRRAFSKLVRQPVLDYLVSQRTDFTVESSDVGIRITTNGV